jgi:nucleoside-diphosphate-sugar epimerase
MRIGVIGLGHIGYSIANGLNSLGHEIHSWTRSERTVPWQNSTDLRTGVDRKFDSVFIASGGAKPNSGNLNLELATTLDLVSNFKLSKRTKLFYISSGAVYGECAVPQSEQDIPEPATEYGKVKLRVEQQLQNIYGDQLSVLRVGNIIDEVNPYGIVAHLSTSIETGTFAAFGKPSDCRDYLTVSDFQICIERLVEFDFQTKLLNLGSGQSVSLEQIELLLTKTMEARINIQWEQRRPGDLSQTRLDITQMRQHLKINPQDPVKKLGAVLSSLNLSNHLSD